MDTRSSYRPPSLSAPKAYLVVQAYRARSQNELSLRLGEVIDVIEQGTELGGWWFGSNKADKEGYFPSSFVKPKPAVGPPPPRRPKLAIGNYNSNIKQPIGPKSPHFRSKSVNPSEVRIRLNGRKPKPNRKPKKRYSAIVRTRTAFLQPVVRAQHKRTNSANNNSRKPLPNKKPQYVKNTKRNMQVPSDPKHLRRKRPSKVSAMMAKFQ